MGNLPIRVPMLMMQPIEVGPSGPRAAAPCPDTDTRYARTGGTCGGTHRTRPWFSILILMNVLVVAGCTLPFLKSSPSQPVGPIDNAFATGTYYIGERYKADGTWYEPKEDPTYNRVGIAAIYDDREHGQRTANNEIHDHTRLSAAHPTLPLPSRVQVTDLRTGQAIEVRVNDRGAYKPREIIKLSKSAADKLGILNDGSGFVQVRYIGQAPLGKASQQGAPARTGQVASLPAVPVAAVGQETIRPPAPSPTPVPTRTVAEPPTQNVRGQSDPARRPGSVPPPPQTRPAVPSPASPPPTIPVEPRVARSSQQSASLSRGQAQLPAPPPANSTNARPLASAAVGRATSVLQPMGGAHLQVGAYGDYQNAVRAAETINSRGASLPEHARATISETLVNGRRLFRVKVGPFQSDQSLNSAKTVLNGLGYRSAIKVDGN